MKWITKEVNNLKVKKISKHYNISDTFATILLNRNLTDRQIELLLNSKDEAIKSPLELKNALEASEIIYNHIQDESNIVYIFADYDCDGATAGYIMHDGLSRVANCSINVFFPEKNQGYGLNMNFVNSLIETENNPNKVLVITVDNGITKVDEVKALQDNGFKVIVTDHHEPQENVPDCLIVDPSYNDLDNKYLAGCGVSFKVTQLVLAHYDKSELIEDYLHAVALGTYADMVPLSEENIALIRYGIEQFNNAKSSNKTILGFREYVGYETISPKDIVFDFAPLINGCGRLNEFNFASKIMFDKEFEDTEDVWNYLLEMNKVRNRAKNKAEVTQEIRDSIVETDNIIIVTHNNEEGISGSMGNAILNLYNKPIMVISTVGEELYTASMRTPQGINAQEILKDLEDKNIISSFGGHENAAGLKLPKESIELIKEYQKSLTLNIQEDESIIDKIITLNDVNITTLNEIYQIPYNDEIQEPVFLIKNVIVKSYAPTKKNPNNMFMKITDTTRTKPLEVWASGLVNTYEKINGDKIDLICNISRNFKNKSTVFLNVLDILQSEE